MSQTQPTLLITGAAGQLGRRVIEILLEQQATQPIGHLIATTRTPAALADLAQRGVEVRRADFDDPQSLVDAFRGAQRLLLISTDALDRPGRRLEQHQRAVRAAEAAGVQRVVYTSLTRADTSTLSIAPDHAGTEAALGASRLDYTILRNNLYADLLLQALPAALASGQLVNARGAGRVGFVTREDCAAAAAAALRAPEGGRHTLEITGPALLSSAEVAEAVSEVFGKPVQHVSVPGDALIQGLVGHGLPEALAQLLASFDTAIARGELAIQSDTVERLAGRAPQSLKQFLSAQRAAVAAAV